jgi:hypothetical protein
MSLPEDAEDAGEQVDPRGRARPDRQGAALQPLEVGDRVPGVAERAEQPGRMFFEDPSGLRQVDGAAEAIKEPGAQIRLELPDVLRERRLAQVESFCGPTKARRPGDRQEDLELPERHGSGFPYRIDLNF